MVKIAYIVLAHKDPEFIKRVALKLTINTENHVFIHIDRKSDINQFLNVIDKNKKIHIISEYEVYWGGYNSILATIALLKFAVDEGDFDRYVILQGTDYPILSNSQINDFFEKYFDTEFVKGVSESDSNNNRNLHKYILKYYMDNPNVFEKLHNKVNILILKLYHGNLPKPYIKIDGIKRNIYRGWAQIALTDAAVKFVLEFHRTHGEYNEYFRHVYAADESYFHTIIYNSVFREKASGIISEEERSHKMLLNLTYFEYFDQVKVFTKKEDYEFLKNTGYLYFRKATSQSKELLDYIDYIHELL